MALKRIPIYDPESPGTVAYWQTVDVPDVDPNAPHYEDPQLPPKPRPMYDPESPGTIMGMSPGGIGDIYLPPPAVPTTPAPGAKAVPAASGAPSELTGPARDPNAQKFGALRESRGLDPRMGSRMDAPISDFYRRVGGAPGGGRGPSYTNADLGAEARAVGSGKNAVPALQTREESLRILAPGAYNFTGDPLLESSSLGYIDEKTADAINKHEWGGSPSVAATPVRAGRIAAPGGMDLSLNNLGGAENAREMLAAGPLAESGRRAAKTRADAFSLDPFADLTAQTDAALAREDARGRSLAAGTYAKGDLAQRDRQAYATEFRQLMDAYQRKLDSVKDPSERSRVDAVFDAAKESLDKRYGYTKETLRTDGNF